MRNSFLNRHPGLTWLIGGTLLVAVAGVGAIPEAYPASAGNRAEASQPQILVTRAEPSQAQGLSLEEAWHLSLQEGHAWNSQAAIVEIQSQSPGNSQAAAPKEGADGRRSAWKAVLAAPNDAKSQLQVRIVNGAVVYAAIEPRTNTAPPIPSLPKLDSSDAIQQALASHPSFAPVIEKGNGFGYLARTSQEGKFIVAVIGSFRGSPARVDFDATTGNLIGASVYTVVSGGILASADGGENWEMSDMPEGTVTGIATVPGQEGVAYAVMPVVESVEIWQTTDGGHHWTRVGQLPETVTWAYGIAAVTPPDGSLRVAVGTPVGLWVSKDGAEWAQSSSLPAGPPQWLSGMQTSSGQGLVVSISAGPNSGVYATSDLITWKKVINGSFRLSATLDGEVAVLGGANPTSGYVIRDGEARPLTLSGPVLRAAGVFGAGGLAVSESPSDVFVSRDGGETWVPTLHDNLASIAVSQDGVILAGGNRSGIFRSVDAGQTWQKVVDASPALMTGNGMATSVVFLSKSRVIATIGGKSAWKNL